MIYVMSDVHGCRARYRSILKQINLKKSDHLYILGDVVDRNPDGMWLLRETMQRENITLLLGNHEYMMHVALTNLNDHDAMWLWYRNGGQITHKRFMCCTYAYRERILEYIAGLPLNVEVTVNGVDYLLVHGAPVSTYSKYSRFANEKEHAVWTRLGKYDPMPNGKIVVFGHTPTKRYRGRYPMLIWQGPQKIGIDCGCAYGDEGRLGCLRLDDMKEFYSEEGL